MSDLVTALLAAGMLVAAFGYAAVGHGGDVGGRPAVADRSISERGDQHADRERRDEGRVQASLYTMEYSG